VRLHCLALRFEYRDAVAASCRIEDIALSNDDAGVANLTGGMMTGLDRRLFLVGAPLFLTGCMRSMPDLSLALPDLSLPDFQIGGTYGTRFDSGHPIAAVDTMRVSPTYLRQQVAYHGPQRPGTIVVDPGHHFLYFVQGGNRALRYGVGVGRQGFEWSGVAEVRRKEAWPTWTPPVEMQRRQPEAARYASGMPGGPGNPLGARALYLYQGSRDTMYRIHGTNDPSSIGRSMSSGCIRLLNQDIIDLFGRAHLGTRVVVLGAGTGEV
jgi:lipoprotein-anchoring transpeptidase ErfK/SrfK